jgi:hypothetical protein
MDEKYGFEPSTYQFPMLHRVVESVLEEGTPVRGCNRSPPGVVCGMRDFSRCPGSEELGSRDVDGLHVFPHTLLDVALA